MGKKSELLNKMLSETDARKDFDLSRKQTDIVDTRFDETKFSSFSLDNDTPDMDGGSDDSEPSPKQFKGNGFFFGGESDPTPAPAAPAPEPIPSPTLFETPSPQAEPEPIPTLPLDEPEPQPKNDFFTAPAPEPAPAPKVEPEPEPEPEPAPAPAPAPAPEPKVEEKPKPVAQPKPEPAKKPAQEAQNVSSNKGKENDNMENMTEVELQILRKILSQTLPNFEGLDYLSEEDLQRIWDTYKNSV